MKLRPRIALVSCLVALVSVAVTGALLVRQSRSYSKDELLQRQTLLVQNRAFALGDGLEVAVRELLRLSRMAEVDLTDNDLRPEASLLAHAHHNSTLFNIGLQIEDAAGRCLWSEPTSPQCPGGSYADEPWFVAGRRATGAVVMSGGPRGEPTVLNLVVPIGGKPGAADGVLRGIIDLRTDRIVSPAMTSELLPGTEAALVAADGSLLFPARLPSGAGWARALAAAPSQRASAFVVDEPLGRFLYSHAPVGRVGWGLTFRFPYAALDVGLKHQLRLLLVILAAGGALAILLGLVSARFLTRPLEALVSAARGLAAERMRGGPIAATDSAGLSAVARRSDELGEVARAFDELRSRIAEGDEVHRQDVERIRDLASSLEERVRARTAELEAAQRSLVAQERLAAMGRAAAVVSHELKNSLNALGMGFDLVALEADRIPYLKRVNEQVRAEVNRLRTMTDELLVFARSPRIEARPVDLQEIIRRTVSLCAEQTAALGVQVETRLAGGGAPLIASCDPERIQSVLVNLLQNAIEAVAWATAPGAPRNIAVGTEEPGPGSAAFASIFVDDSGPGVAAEAQAHLFEPFFTTKRNGTGLGLATAQRFVAAHGGRIELERSPLGGARFLVRLPLRNLRAGQEGRAA